MQVKDYPGLMRVIAWVINGLDLLVENAKYGLRLLRTLLRHHPCQQCFTQLHYIKLAPSAV